MPLLPRRSILACLVAATLLLVSALVLAQNQPDGKPAAVSSRVEGVDPSSYRVGPEDVLEISVWHEDALKKEVLVRPDGGVSYPLIGDVQAAGKTVLEIRDEITTAP